LKICNYFTFLLQPFNSKGFVAEFHEKDSEILITLNQFYTSTEITNISLITLLLIMPNNNGKIIQACLAVIKILILPELNRYWFVSLLCV